MTVRRRLALVVLALPFAFYAYACSSSSSDGGGGGEGDDGGGSGNEGGGNPGSDSSTGNKDSSTGGDGSTKDAGDAGDGATGPTCIGNPLFADGGTPDGGATVDAGSVIEIVTAAGGGTFLDGPQWVSGGGAGTGGFLVYSEFTNTEQLHRVGPDGGGAAIFRTAGLGANLGPIGNAVRNGLVLTTASAKGGGGVSTILVTAPDGGALANISTGDAGSPNDLAIGKNGSIYFTDPRYQAGAGITGVYATAPDGGGAARFASFNGGEQPNGIALSPDGTKLYIGFTSPKRIDSYPVNPATGLVTPTATTVVTAAELTDAPDGIAVDVGGNLWVAEANANGGVVSGRVEVFKPTGQRWGQIIFNNQRPTSVAFGGPQNTTLFITVEKGVYTYVGRCAGIP
jgi:gluconolactonase